MYGCLGWSSWVRDVLQVALKGFVMGTTVLRALAPWCLADRGRGGTYSRQGLPPKVGSIFVYCRRNLREKAILNLVLKMSIISHFLRIFAWSRAGILCFFKGFRFKPLAESLCLRASLILRPTLEMLNG